MIRSRISRLLGLGPFAALLILGPMGSMAEEAPVDLISPWRYAPIATPYHFAWWKATAPWMKGFSDTKLVRHVTFETMANKAELAWWEAQSVWAGGWAWGTIGGAPTTAEGYEQYFLERIEGGETAFAFDEWINEDKNNPRNAAQAEACRRIKEQHPHVFLAAFTDMRSEAFIEALKNDWVDLAIIMSYTQGEAYKAEQAFRRLAAAREHGVLEKSIPSFWIGAGYPIFTAEWLEKWIRIFRQEFPQMPGVGPLLYESPDELDPPTAAKRRNLVRVLDRLIEKYYVEPAPQVRIVQPRDGEMVEGAFRLTVEADKPVARWRLFIGAEQIETRPGAQGQAFTFDIPALESGSRILTVHAITHDWHRGAEQIEVEVQSVP